MTRPTVLAAAVATSTAGPERVDCGPGRGGHSWTGADPDGGTLNAGCLAIARLAGRADALSHCLP